MHCRLDKLSSSDEYIAGWINYRHLTNALQAVLINIVSSDESLQIDIAPSDECIETSFEPLRGHLDDRASRTFLVPFVAHRAAKPFGFHDRGCVVN